MDKTTVGRGEVVVVHQSSKLGEIETLDYALSHELGSEQNDQASKGMSAAERASKASKKEQANE